MDYPEYRAARLPRRELRLHSLYLKFFFTLVVCSLNLIRVSSKGMVCVSDIITANIQGASLLDNTLRQMSNRLLCYINTNILNYNDINNIYYLKI